MRPLARLYFSYVGYSDVAEIVSQLCTRIDLEYMHTIHIHIHTRSYTLIVTLIVTSLVHGIPRKKGEKIKRKSRKLLLLKLRKFISARKAVLKIDPVSNNEVHISKFGHFIIRLTLMPCFADAPCDVRYARCLEHPAPKTQESGVDPFAITTRPIAPRRPVKRKERKK